MTMLITIQNDGTGDEIEGNYDVRIHINNFLIYVGRIEHHNRLTGWRGLIGILGEQVSEGLE